MREQESRGIRDPERLKAKTHRMEQLEKRQDAAKTQINQTPNLTVSDSVIHHLLMNLNRNVKTVIEGEKEVDLKFNLKKTHYTRNGNTQVVISKERLFAIL